MKTSRVQIDTVTQERADETFINPDDGQTETLHDRPPLVLRATVDPPGLNPRPVIVVVNHLRSFIDIELVAGDGPRVRAKRTAQAESIAGLLQELQTDNPARAVISIGDYNAYQFNDGYTDPIAVTERHADARRSDRRRRSPDLVNPNFVNLTDALPPAERYSFIFEGTPQALDHVLVNTVALVRAALRDRARQRRLPRRPLFAERPDAARAQLGSRHAGRLLPLPAAFGRRGRDGQCRACDGGGGSKCHLHHRRHQQRHFAGADRGRHGALPALLAFASCSASGSGVCGGTPGNPTATYVCSRLAHRRRSRLSPASAAQRRTAHRWPPASAPRRRPAFPRDQQLIVGHRHRVERAAHDRRCVSESAAAADAAALTPVTIDYTVSDACGRVTTTLSVVSNEAVTAAPNQQGKPGSTSPDWRVVDDHNVLVRAERSVKGNGRVYTITIRAVDAAGGVATRQVTVTVPRHLRIDPDRVSVTRASGRRSRRTPWARRLRHERPWPFRPRDRHTPDRRAAG